MCIEGFNRMETKWICCQGVPVPDSTREEGVVVVVFSFSNQLSNATSTKVGCTI